MKILVALLDVKTNVFLAPLCAATPAEAERTYGEILRQEQSLIAKHPHDFPLYEVGKFDEQTGEVFPVMDGNRICAPRQLLNAAQLGLSLVKEA